ncbi:hypothetical protein ACOZFK_33695, partial [Streptomyces pseudogriseolus]
PSPRAPPPPPPPARRGGAPPACSGRRARPSRAGRAPPPLVGSVRGRLRLLLAGFVAGGRAAVRAIAAADYDVLPGPPKPGTPQLLREAGVTLRGKG